MPHLTNLVVPLLRDHDFRGQAPRARLWALWAAAAISALPLSVQAQAEPPTQDEAEPTQADDTDTTGDTVTDNADEPESAASSEDGGRESAPPSESRVINEQEQALQEAQADTQRQRASVSVLDEVEEEPVPPRSMSDRRHERQFYVRIGSGINFLFALRFKDGPECEAPSADPEEFCRRVSEPFLDLEVGYGVSSKLEIALFANLMLTDDPAADSKPRSFGLGLRGYTSEDALAKGFFGVRLLFDVTPSERPRWQTFDVGLRGEVGVQFDPIRWMGIFISGAATIRFLRGFYLLPELGGGLQFRFP